MNLQLQRSPADWYRVATRRYIEGHQACAWCGGSHRVFKSRHGSRQEYACSSCEFYVAYDPESKDYFVEPGRSLEPAELAPASSGR
jgi:hypothetical protein